LDFDYYAFFGPVVEGGGVVGAEEYAAVGDFSAEAVGPQQLGAASSGEAVEAVHEVGGGDGAVDAHEVGHPEVPVAGVGVYLVGLNLEDAGGGGAFVNAGAGGPFPFQIAVFIDPDALLGDADDDALVLDNGQRQQGIGRGDDDGLADE
jgi:hypothetical protein